MTTLTTTTVLTFPPRGTMVPSDPMMVPHRCDAALMPHPTLTGHHWMPPTRTGDLTDCLADFLADLSANAIPRHFPTDLPDPRPGKDDPGLDLYTIELGPQDTRVVTQAQKLALKADGTSFLDITDFDESASVARSLMLEEAIYSYPSTMQHRHEVENLLGRLRKDNIESNIRPFTSFYNRFFDSDMGKNASDWLLAKVRDVVSESEASNVKVAPFEHSWKQNSIIATIPGANEKTVVIGAHLDSINRADVIQGSGFHGAPGADDNASGVMAILEAFRVLLSDPKILGGDLPCTVEFHWYAAEEVGLKGSLKIFETYANEGRPVYAMLNQDMIAYTSPLVSGFQKPHIGVVTDDVNQKLTAFVKEVIETYSLLDWKDMQCGYACSDHASANRTHFPSALISESINPRGNAHYHTTEDSVEDLNFDHALEFAKVAVGFAYELAFSDM